MDGDQPIGALPSIEQCLFHRCDAHDKTPQLDDSVNGAECGACIFEMLIATRAQLLLALDGYAERLSYSRALARKLDSARARLNLLSPGAGTRRERHHGGAGQQQTGHGNVGREEDREEGSAEGRKEGRRQT